MTKHKSLTPDQLFDAALAEAGPNLTAGGVRLLVSGLAFLKNAQEKRLNEIELKAISGMISFVAYTQEVNEATVMAVLSTHFSVEDVKMIPSRLYDSALDFLMNVKMEHVVN